MFYFSNYGLQQILQYLIDGDGDRPGIRGPHFMGWLEIGLYVNDPPLGWPLSSLDLEEPTFLGYDRVSCFPWNIYPFLNRQPYVYVQNVPVVFDNQSDVGIPIVGAFYENTNTNLDPLFCVERFEPSIVIPPFRKLVYTPTLALRSNLPSGPTAGIAAIAQEDKY
jgi:hypothetical protein